jgi:hypothetical protein
MNRRVGLSKSLIDKLCGAGRLATVMGFVAVSCLFIASNANVASSHTLEGSRKASDLILVVESEQQVYRAGDRINIRIGIHNRGSIGMGLVLTSPWVGSTLFVTDANGNRLKPIHPKNAADYPDTHGYSLYPGKTVYLEWQGKEYFDLSNWGYELTEPGTYTITGIPLTSVSYMVPDTSTVRSNSLTIQILSKT